MNAGRLARRAVRRQRRRAGRHVAWIGGGLLAGGLLILAGGIVMIVFGARGDGGRHRPRPPGRRPGAPAAPGLDGEPGTAVEAAALPGRSPAARSPRGAPRPGPQPLAVAVKWLLAIPHFIVLVLPVDRVLRVLTVVAFFAILFTGRYPRGIFDFNVGVLRWTWRVASTPTARWAPIGTRRSRSDDAPTTRRRSRSTYPERLSRGLVLVKWWLLAIPQYIIVAAARRLGDGAAGATAAGGRGLVRRAAAGLIGLLVLFAGVALLFTGRYPRGLFDLVIGLNRWVFRVVAYAA